MRSCCHLRCRVLALLCVFLSKAAERRKCFLSSFSFLSPPFSLFFSPPQAFPLPGLVSVQLERVRGRMWRDVRSAGGQDVYRSRHSYWELTSTDLVCVFRTELWNNFKNKLNQLPEPNHSCSVQIDKIIDVIYVLCVHTFEHTHRLLTVTFYASCSPFQGC